MLKSLRSVRLKVVSTPELHTVKFGSLLALRSSIDGGSIPNFEGNQVFQSKKAYNLICGRKNFTVA
jgi:hypothetical protein